MTERATHMISATTWGGALVASAGALSLSEWMAVGGFTLALCGFAINVWHKISVVRLARAELRLKRELAEAARPVD